MGRSWYPPFNSGASTYFTLKSGAEMTCQEVRFVPVRFKDAYGPVGAWFLLFKSKATNAKGEDYMETRSAELDKWAPYGNAKPTPANLRNYLMLLELEDGNGPIYMRTDEAIKELVAEIPDEKQARRKLKELESEAWEDAELGTPTRTSTARSTASIGAVFTHPSVTKGPESRLGKPQVQGWVPAQASTLHPARSRRVPRRPERNGLVTPLWSETPQPPRAFP
mgnify:CR=1 FL=1